MNAPAARKYPDESSHFNLGDQLPVEQVAPGIRRQLMGYGDQIMLARVWFEQGAVGAVHRHFHAQVTYVESGLFDVRVGEETRMLKAGDSFYMPPHIDHGAVCLEAGVLLDVFSPARADFLTGEGYSNEI